MYGIPFVQLIVSFYDNIFKGAFTPLCSYSLPPVILMRVKFFTLSLSLLAGIALFIVISSIMCKNKTDLTSFD